MPNVASHASGRQLRSLIKADGTLELSLTTVPTPEPAADEVVVRVEAAPINPSDLGLLFGPADPTTLRQSGDAHAPVVTATVPEKAMRMVAARVGKSLPVGNEGAGTVVAAGASPAAQALVGKVVAVLGGAMYSQFRCVKVGQCLAMEPGTTAVEAASSFVNPLTALGMVETMRREGHRALVHTAAASSLGQMLVRICRDDGVPLVNVVRRSEQAATLRELGATHVCDTSAPTFAADLASALGATGATLAFDAIGGGKLAGQLLAAMEAALIASGREAGVYGTAVPKQVYVYGALDLAPIEIGRGQGMAWGVGGWLLTPFLQRLGADGADALKKRVAREIRTTFASAYGAEVSLAGALSLAAIAGYGRRATGAKYLVRPQAD
jgi:NADPH:quinone reductase-like Zn-dependent oxidoreductase